MTYEQYRNIADTIPIINGLFAAESENVTEIEKNLPGSGLLNYLEGFPIDYATPPSENGKRVLLSDVNAIGNVGTQELYLRQHGGYHTFNPDVAKAIDGYAFGAILDYFDESTGWLRKVRCVKPYGRCFTPIDDPKNGVYSTDPHWVFVDVNGRIHRDPFRLGDKVSESVPMVNGKSQVYSVPCNCLGRILIVAYGTLYDVGNDDNPKVIEHVTTVNFPDANKTLTVAYDYSGWLRNGGRWSMGGFFREGERFKVETSNYDGKMLLYCHFDYRECLK